MTEGAPKYTDRQLKILRREIEPETNEEYEYLQDHNADILPPDVKDRKPIYSITGDDLERSRQHDRGSTPRAHWSESVDEKEDKDD